jgi:hypothetical protein
MDRRSPHAGAHRTRRLLCATALSVVAATSVFAIQAQSAALPCGLDLRVLVISADGKEAVLPAITSTLDSLGTPYTLHIASAQPGALTGDFFQSGCRGFYQGIVQTSASLAYTPDGGVTWLSALSPVEASALIAYQTAFDVRQVNWYAFPTPDIGLFFTGTIDTAARPLPVRFTAAGRAAFRYLSAVSPVPRHAANARFPQRPAEFAIAGAWTYLASPIDAATIPLLTDAKGNVLAAVREHADGREVLTLTFDGNAHLRHSIVLGQGLINWVTRGVFIGERRVYMSPQVDDVFVDNDRWLPTTPCGTPTDATGSTVRMTGDDYLAAVAWEELRRVISVTRDLRLTMAFNGYGTEAEAYPNDTLTSTARRYERFFHWVNHTYTHPNLDAAPYEAVLDEVTRNHQVARAMRFTLYSPATLVTPQISGLQNADAMRAAYDAGIRYVVTDTSRPGHTNPFPNVGLPNWHVPGIYMIPRRPNNLFYNVAAPADWQAEYNCLYETFWGRRLTYPEILEQESETLLGYMLRGDMNPWMFHQPNLVAYDGRRSLLTDLLDLTLAKYHATYNLPVMSPPMAEIGRRMQEWGARLDAGVTGFLSPDGSITLSAARAATVPVTGFAIKGAEKFGPYMIARLKVAPGTTATFRVR